MPWKSVTPNLSKEIFNKNGNFYAMAYGEFGKCDSLDIMCAAESTLKFANLNFAVRAAVPTGIKYMDGVRYQGFRLTLKELIRSTKVLEQR